MIVFNHSSGFQHRHRPVSHAAGNGGCVRPLFRRARILAGGGLAVQGHHRAACLVRQGQASGVDHAGGQSQALFGGGYQREKRGVRRDQPRSQGVFGDDSAGSVSG